MNTDEMTYNEMVTALAIAEEKFENTESMKTSGSEQKYQKSLLLEKLIKRIADLKKAISARSAYNA